MISKKAQLIIKNVRYLLVTNSEYVEHGNSNIKVIIEKLLSDLSIAQNNISTNSGDITELNNSLQSAINSLNNLITTGDNVNSDRITNLKNSLEKAISDINTARSKEKTFVNVVEYGAVGDGVTDCTKSFNDACATGKTVYVPKGNWLINNNTNRGFWFLDFGCKIKGLPTIDRGDYHMTDNSRLTGKIFDMSDITDHGIRIGSGDSWLERDIRRATECFAELSVLSRTGQIGLLSGTRTSLNNRNGMEAIGVASYGINDDATNKNKTCWAGYLEVRRSDGCGNTHGLEIDNVNFGQTTPLTPYSALGTDSGINPSLWLSSGGGDSSLNSHSATCAIGVLPNPAKFLRGIVFRDGSIDASTNEMITSPLNYKMAWYGKDNLPKTLISDKAHFKSVEDDNPIGCYVDTYVKRRATTTTTQSGDIIQRTNYAGENNGTDINIGYTQFMQRGEFTNNKATSSFDISCTNSDGTTSQISLNGMLSKSFSPYPDNTISLGTSSNRYSTVYAGSGTIQTSDENYKEDIKDIPIELINAFDCLSPKVFKFKESVELKGNEARYHMGYIAQELEQILIDKGLKPSDYAIWCKDEIIEYSENEEGVITGVPTGTYKQSLRYSDFISLMHASNNRKFNDLNARINKLEKLILTINK